MEEVRVACETNKDLESVLKTFERMGVAWRTGHKATTLLSVAPCSIYWSNGNYLLHGHINDGCFGYRDMTSAEFLGKFSAKKTIVVYQKDARTVVAVEKSGGKVLRSAKAKCSPEDVFDFDAGAQFALDRLFGKIPPYRRVIKQDTYAVGDKVLIKSWEEMEKEYRLRGTENIDCDCVFTQPMSEWCGEVMAINFITAHGKYLTEDSGHTWSNDMIKGKVVEE